MRSMLLRTLVLVVLCGGLAFVVVRPSAAPGQAITVTRPMPTPTNATTLQRLDWWKTYYPDLYVAAPATSEGTPTPDPPGGKGRALCIGLNHINPKFYGTDGSLAGCVNDANDMVSIARSQGFDVTQLLNEEANRDAVIRFLTNASNELKSGDILMISYSGHGMKVPSELNPFSEQDSAWCLFDAPLVDDQVGFQLTKFAAGVRILVIMDSCFSAAAARDLQFERFLSRPHKVLSSSFVSELKKKHAAKKKDPFKEGQPSAVRRLSVAVKQKIGKDRKKLEKIRALAVKFSKEEIDKMTNATVVTLSAAGSAQEALDGDNNGFFTEQLKKVWSNADFKGNYNDFLTAIKALMPPNETPNLDPFGKNTDQMLKQRPFQR
jgi:hypothetical protein